MVVEEAICFSYGGEWAEQLPCCESVTTAAPLITPGPGTGPAVATQFVLVPPTLAESDDPGPVPTWAEPVESAFVGEPPIIKPPGEFAVDVLAELVAQPPEEPL